MGKLRIYGAWVEMQKQAALIKRETDTDVSKGIGGLSLLRSVVRNRRLVVELARRELSDQHAGQLGGAIWLIAHPLIFFLVYAFLFTIVFKVRIGSSGPSDYVVYLLAGLAPWLITQDALIKGATIMFANATVVKKVMFPTEILVAKGLIASAAVQGVLLLVACTYAIAVRGSVPLTFLLLPVLVIAHGIFLWGAALFLGAFTPYFRDTPEFLRVFLTVNVYLMPVMYTPQMVPGKLRALLSLNPFSHIIWCYQDAIYYGRIEHPTAWIVTAGFAVLMLLVGSYVFQRLRHQIANVL